jgi:hypothetical protein
LGANVEDIVSIDPGTSVLLLGSGFSLESTNIRGNAPPNGTGLRQHFIGSLGLPPDTSYDIQVLADEFAEKDAEKLHRELYDIFRISSVSAEQARIFAENWSRIYTTNYDDTVEVCHLKRGVEPRSFDVSNEVPNKLPKNSIVHLHGSIRAVTADNVLSSLVLGETSYVRQYLGRSPWYNQFQTDIKFASHVFIVGYSMADYHISALLLENPGIAEKTFFIQRAKQDEMFLRRTKAYGRTLFIGIGGFSNALQTLPRPEALSDISRLRSFRALDPQRDRKGLRPPTANETFELLVFGAFNYVRCAATPNGSKYVIERQKEISSLLHEFRSNRTVVVDGRLGNGKTIFLYLAFIALAAEGWSCFLFKEEGPDIEEEIKLLGKVPKLVILFDQYAASQDMLKRLGADLPNAKFIAEIRTSIFEVRYHEIDRNVPKPFARIGLNRLSSTDIAAFKDLCSKAGLGAARLPTLSSTEMRDILLEVFESANIKAKITLTLRPIFDSPTRRRVLLLSTMLSNFHIAADPSFIRSVTGLDPFKEFMPVKDIADEIFEIGLDDFGIRSSVFAEYVVQYFLEPAEIVDCVVDAALATARRKAERQYRVLMSNLMQYSQLRQMLKGHPNASMLIPQIYERLRYDERINDEPLFWLQYAIAMDDNDNLPAANEFLDTAYARAAVREGFQTYQIDTQAFRILLRIETEGVSGQPVAKFQAIIDKLALLNSMISEESHRLFAIKVLEHIHPFVRVRGTDLTKQEKTVLVYWLATISGTLGQLSANYRAQSGSDQTRGVIESTRTLLLK